MAAIRQRGLLYLNYVLWALAASALLVAVNLGTTLFARWIAFLEGAPNEKLPVRAGGEPLCASPMIIRINKRVRMATRTRLSGVCAVVVRAM